MQLAFIDNGPARARRADPSTSKVAAAQVDEFAADHVARILRALSYGEATIYELERSTGLDHVAIARRMSELKRAGLAKTTGETREGPSGRACRIWRVA